MCRELVKLMFVLRMCPALQLRLAQEAVHLYSVERWFCLATFFAGGDDERK
jgi:hypothetical protein